MLRQLSAVTLVGLAACSFSGTTGGSGDGDGDGDAGNDVDASMVIGNDATIDGPAALALCDPARGDLRACFEFENNSDDAIGVVGATTELGTPAYVTGVEGQAIAFDGNDNLVLGPDTDFNVTNLTMDAWVNMTAPGSGRSGIGDIEQHFGVFVYPGGELRCVIAGSTSISSLQTGATLANDTWHHVVCRHTPGRGNELLIDGDVVACSTNANALGTGAEPFMIGANSPNNDSRLVGAVDSLRYFGDELSLDELCAAANRDDCQVVAAGCNLQPI